MVVDPHNTAPAPVLAAYPQPTQASPSTVIGWSPRQPLVLVRSERSIPVPQGHSALLIPLYTGASRRVVWRCVVAQSAPRHACHPLTLAMLTLGTLPSHRGTHGVARA